MISWCINLGITWEKSNRRQTKMNFLLCAGKTTMLMGKYRNGDKIPNLSHINISYSVFNLLIP
jgi:hypothetical protein